MPMTEIHTYQLSTAENELGVVIAHSDEGKDSVYLSSLLLSFLILIAYYVTGVAMVPISWTQMQCPKSLCKEFRKVAKVVPEHIVAEQAQ